MLKEGWTNICKGIEYHRCANRVDEIFRNSKSEERSIHKTIAKTEFQIRCNRQKSWQDF